MLPRWCTTRPHSAMGKMSLWEFWLPSCNASGWEGRCLPGAPVLPFSLLPDDAQCTAQHRAESSLEKSLCKSSPLSWPKFSVPIRSHWSCCCYKKSSLVVASQSCSHPKVSQQKHFHICWVFFSWLSEFILLHSALFDISKMALITQVVRNVGDAGLGAPLWGSDSFLFPTRHPTFCRNNNSATCKIVARHKGDYETCPLPPNAKFSPNSPPVPLWRRAMVHSAATHTLTRQNSQP